ncbi:class I SAM-dependent methyltransferase [Polyangium aurulentum]|uniref:class I SAM-dependent methyltransferase n=1 Tax=Polyangium aurulentum TaxID=2567896 RepID=UPI0010AEB205|nr:class I SAM-dependent methyltransferase [Polyangium aurulentum]UQA62034.1 class I SAM-dependent methyltransferase [Polyangium aurulentum]
MKTGYDSSADFYDLSYEAPIRRYVERFTFKNLIGDVRGLSILDVACGDGLYTRMLRRMGAARVLGIDLSEKMIEMARAKEASEPLGVEYRAADVAGIGRIGTFDLVTAVYLLHYAHSFEHLSAMCGALYENLAPGGRLVTFVASPSFPEASAGDSLSEYGFKIDVAEPERDGSPGTLMLKYGALEMQAPFFRWKRETYERCLRAAGFSSVTWGTPTLEPEGLEKLGDAYWKHYMQHPHCAFITCSK